jgi:hypothetical protein
MGWLRVYRSLENRFREAEVIVVAAVVPDSVGTYPVVAGAREYAAALSASEVLKGALTDPTVPVVLHHGLTPVVGGLLDNEHEMIDAGHRREGVIELWDTGNSALGPPFVADAREEHIWLLSRHSDYWVYNGHTVPEYARQLGISEPDEVLPMSEKDAVIRLLAELDPDWLTTDVLGVAHAIRAERAFDQLPILADALEEAGCDNVRILAHCRHPGPHSHSCWVLDLVLNKR